MRVSEVPHGLMTVVDVRPLSDDRFEGSFGIGAEAELRFPEAGGAPLLRIGDAIWTVRGTDDSGVDALAGIGERHLPALVWVAAVRGEAGWAQRLTLQVHEFPRHDAWDDPVDIGVDEHLVEAATRKFERLAGASPSQILGWLGDELLLLPPIGGATGRALMCASPTRGGSERAFRLLGRRMALDARRDSDGRLVATRIVRQTPSGNDVRPIHLLHAQIRFANIDEASEVRQGVRTELDRIASTADSYLRLWREYNALEQGLILDRARELGSIRYERREQRADGLWWFELVERGDTNTSDRWRRPGDLGAITFEAGERPLSLATARAGGVGEEDGEADDPWEHAFQHRGAFLGEIEDATRERWIVLRSLFDEEDRRPPSSGYLYVSLGGDARRLQRRVEAERRIRTATCAMPRLGLILEDAPDTVSRPKHEKPVTRAVREALGGREPLQAQIDALDVALNTPDIALIQGPPGTGKTEVIAALRARLAELAEKQGQVVHTTLLTSYQHDAVENAVARTKVLGLPPMLEGGRWGAQPTTATIDRIWSTEQVERLRSHLQQLPERPRAANLREVREKRASYAAAPGTPEDAARLLETVAKIAGEHLDSALHDRLFARTVMLRRQACPAWDDDADAHARAVVATRAIRITSAGFEDDGAVTARRAIRPLDSLGVLDPDERGLLEQAAAWVDEESPPFLGALGILRDRLIDRLQRPTVEAAPSLVDAETDDLLGAVVAALERQVRESPEGVADVLASYLHDLEHDPAAVQETLRDCSAVLAATCQQSAGHRVRLAKLGQMPGTVEFDSIIVDEASRANPLDLFIPMAMAKRRIVLVGDQRQLPHMLEPDVERELRGASPSTRGEYQRGLFELLFERMRERQTRDGIRRTVTLDTQFRMHEVLGDFVSRVFYESKGDPRIKAGRPAADFAHGLPSYEGKVVAWLKVEHNKGGERPGRSKSRPIEAKRVVAELRRLLDAPASRGLTFGVITFYTAQARELWEELVRQGVAEPRAGGSGYDLVSRYSLGHDRDGRPIERLRVGTVDAFQGKEFDVVFLSMVRSNTIQATPGDETLLFQKYGHLRLENRLCVAMSRQRLLLVVAGDVAMVRGDTARAAVPALFEFFDLCSGTAHGHVFGG